MTLNEIVNILEGAGIPSALNEACILASHFTGKSRAVLLCDRGAPVTEDTEALAALKTAVERRASREPLQYIIGKWDFMGLTFEVTPDCLIPRADTELLCELAIEKTPKGGRFLDLCTGSGCIAVSVAHARADLDVSALEKYHAPLAVAKRNCKRLLGEEKIRFVEADVTSHLAAFGYFGGEKFDFIAVNPPYVTAAEMEALEPELSREPRHALTDEGDGLSIIREMIHIYPVFLSPGGIFAVEHGSTQGEAVRKLFFEAGHVSTTLRDLSGNERVTYIQAGE